MAADFIERVSTERVVALPKMWESAEWPWALSHFLSLKCGFNKVSSSGTWRATPPPYQLAQPMAVLHPIRHLLQQYVFIHSRKLAVYLLLILICPPRQKLYTLLGMQKGRITWMKKNQSYHCTLMPILHLGESSNVNNWQDIRNSWTLMRYWLARWHDVCE